MSDKKTALITGASSGIGAAFARILAGEGYDLVLHGRRRPQLEALGEELNKKWGINCVIQLAELTTEAGISSLEKAIQKYRPAVLINNAGYGDDIVFEDSDISYHINMLKVHVEATIRLTHASIPYMREAGQGVIINVSSIAGLIATGGSVSYNATKAYLVRFSEALSLNLRGSGIRISALCPGFTHTDFHAKMGMTESDKTRWSRNWMPAVRVAELGWKAALRGKVVYVPGFRNKLMTLVSILPVRVRLWLTGLVSGRSRKKEQ